MYKYEITKYNPSFRDNNRRYLKNDWTAISDIGKTFSDGRLTIEKYKLVEDSYISAIIMVMDFIGIPYLTVNNVIRSFPYNDFIEFLEDYKELYSNEMIDMYLHVKNLQNLDKGSIDKFCRLLLREDIGAKVYYKDEIEVFIGYDYLMSIHTSKPIDKLIHKIENKGLFVEKI